MAAIATIRVSVATRDLLARVAETRGTSVPKLLAEFAKSEHLHQVYAQEREAWRTSLEDPAVRAELELWDEVAIDDFD